MSAIHHGDIRGASHHIRVAETALTAPVILPLRNDVTMSDVVAACPGTAAIYACDFYIEGAEYGEAAAGGFRLGRVWNIDHHAPVAGMARAITSTMLAIQHLEWMASEGKSIDAASRVVINHTDCDSILSSALLLGLVAPSERLVRSSVCADHTGEEDDVADLLQGLDESRRGDRNDAQYSESVRNLKLLLAVADLEPRGNAAIESRHAKRAAARRIVDEGKIRVEAGVAACVLEDAIDGALFPALVPDAVVIMLAVPHVTQPGWWEIKLRLGLAAPVGLTLDRLGLRQFDANFGGRWNAGSNKRGGGSGVSPDDYARFLRGAIARFAS